MNKWASSNSQRCVLQDSCTTATNKTTSSRSWGLRGTRLSWGFAGVNLLNTRPSRYCHHLFFRESTNWASERLSNLPHATQQVQARFLPRHHLTEVGTEARKTGQPHRVHWLFPTGPHASHLTETWGRKVTSPGSLSEQSVELGFHPWCSVSEILFIPLPSLAGRNFLVIGRRQ